MGLTRIRAQQITDIDYKQAVRVVTTENVTLVAGAGSGAPNQVDGVNLSTGNRILVKGQTNKAQNGLYQVETVGAGNSGTWIRTNDANNNGEIDPGMLVMVTEGEEYADTLWKLVTNGEIIIGQTELTFELNTAFGFGNISANGTGVVATVQNDTLSLTAGENITIVGNATSKTIEFSAISSTPGGNTAEVQYNNAGSFAGSDNFTFDGSNVDVGGNITASYFLGNGSQLSGIITSVANINNGTTNVSIDVINGPVTVDVNGIGNTAVFDTAGLTVTGNISANYFLGNGSQLTGIVAGGGITWTTQANSAPSTPAAGDFWYDSYTDKKYQYTDDGVSDYWVDQSFPTSYSSLAVTGNIVAGNVLITGNIVGNISVETITANVVGNLTGLVLTSAQPAITSVGTLDSLSVTGNIETAAYFIGNGSQLTGISSISSFIANGTSNVSIASTDGNIAATVSGTEILKITSAGIENSRANGVGNIGSSTTYFNTVFAKATSAQYADLAEMYLADRHYNPGTVLVFGGIKEVTASMIDHDPRVAGVVSTQPSYLMNSGLSGKYPVELALTGRVPCQVQGPVEKGDRLVNIAPGVAGRLNLDKYQVGCVIGKSLEIIQDESMQLIEIAIGRY
jgi:hypothetical protein